MENRLLKMSLAIVFAMSFSNFAKSNNQVTDSIAAIDSTESKIKLSVGADIMSRYIWRGTDYGNSPSIQPTLALVAGNFELGCWGAISTNSFYKEVDLYAKYTYKNFSLLLTDYYVPSVNGTPASADVRFFTFDDKKTAHSIEGSLLYKGGDKLPLWIQGGIFCYGNDKRWGFDAVKDSTEATYYSSYFEAGYTFKINENNLDVFVGATPAAGAYGDNPGIINIGFTGYRKIALSDKYELPIKTSLIFNPQMSSVYFVLGITL
jgi:hypothetical protein